MITDPTALVFVVVALAALAFWLEGRFSWARQVGASLLVIVLGAVLSNLDLVPLASPVYDGIFGTVTSLAIVWLLLAVDLRHLKAAGPRMLGAFAVAVLATAVGTLVAALVFAGQLPTAVWKLAGVMTGTYAGGSVNFVAVGRAVELEPSVFVAATAADNVMTALWMGATLMLPLWLVGRYPKRPASAPATTEGKAGTAESNPLLAAVTLRPFDLLALATLGFGCILASEAIAGVVPAVPSVVWLSTLALVLGQLPSIRRLEGALPLGLVALHLFFAVIGIGSKISEILAVGPEIFYFTATVVLIHGLLVYGGGRLLRLDVETLSVASQAAVGGPSTAMALAVSRGWRDLALPGLMVGLLGYAVGNYAGLAVAWLVRGWM